MTHIQERIQICIAKIIQHNSFVKNIFEEIYQQGGRVLLVGGAVRDCLMGCVGSDLDFEVYHLSFDELQAILQKFGKVSFIGKSFGVLRLHHFNADWSIPRTDSYGRKPTVELNPNLSFAQAFRRRDVTVNAMGIDVMSYELIDPFNGQADLHNKILRSPDVSFFVQDPLRLFRVMQLAARFEMQVDHTLSHICRGMDISNVSTERVEQEFSKLFLKSTKPSIGLAWLQSIERLSEILPHVTIDQTLYDNLDCLAQQDAVSDEHKLAAFWTFLSCRLEHVMMQSVLIHERIPSDQSKMLTRWLERYIGSQAMIQKVVHLAWYLRYIPMMVQEENMHAYKWLAHWTHTWFSLQVLSDIAICWYGKEVVEQFIHQAKQAKVLYQPQEALIKAKDLIAYVQGKDLGEALHFAYATQLEQDITDPAKLLAIVIKKLES